MQIGQRITYLTRYRARTKLRAILGVGGQEMWALTLVGSWNVIYPSAECTIFSKT
jgi:hypothetical protein